MCFDVTRQRFGPAGAHLYRIIGADVSCRMFFFFFFGVHSALNCHLVKPCHFLTYLPASWNWDTLWGFFSFLPQIYKNQAQNTCIQGKLGTQLRLEKKKKKPSKMKSKTCTLNRALSQFALNVTTIKGNWWALSWASAHHLWACFAKTWKKRLNIIKGSKRCQHIW